MRVFVALLLTLVSVVAAGAETVEEDLSMQTGDPSAACRAATKAEKYASSEQVKSDIALLRHQAKCGTPG